MPHFSSRVNDAISRIVCSARGIVTELTNRQSNSQTVFGEIQSVSQSVSQSVVKSDLRFSEWSE